MCPDIANHHTSYGSPLQSDAESDQPIPFHFCSSQGVLRFTDKSHSFHLQLIVPDQAFPHEILKHQKWSLPDMKATVKSSEKKKPTHQTKGVQF